MSDCLKVWIGTGGIPISSKDGSTLDGLRRISELGLNAFECEFVRGVHMRNDLAKEVGELAKKLKIRLSVHAPYYINLLSNEKEKIQASKKRIINSAERAHFMKADVIVVHPAYYGKLSKEEAYQRVKKECGDIVDRLQDMGIKNVRIGLETMGKISQFGTVDELVRLSKEVKGCCVVVDWSHVYARNFGRIDFSEVFDKVLSLKPKHIHTHFSCIEYSDKGGRRHLTLDSEQPRYDDLVKEINKRKVDITLISESPNLEVDALKLKEMIEKN